MQMVGEEFLDRLEFFQSSWLPARVVVEEAVKSRHQVQDYPAHFLKIVFPFGEQSSHILGKKGIF